MLTLCCTFILAGCKKSEDDPFLSLKSRDARITGEWKLVEMLDSSVETYSSPGFTETYVAVSRFDGTTAVYSETYTDESGTSSDSSSHAYLMEITIKKDGAYKLVQSVDEETVNATGEWWWESDTKNKSRITLDDDMGSMTVARLADKDLVLTRKIGYDDEYSGGQDGSYFSTYLRFEKVSE